MNRWSIERGAVDYVLGGVATAMAVYAMGLSIAANEMALLMTCLVATGTIISAIVNNRLGETKFARFGIIPYAIALLSSPFLSRAINPSLPGGGFPPELMISAAPIVWMLVFGAFFLWTDGALAFQAVPAIAVFGLVGAFNTFAGATVTFFVFLLCAAALYARTHQRTMLVRATRSGYQHLTAIRHGPWRWMAGPEWALVSAGVVIVLSLIGAPIIQESVKGVSGVMKFTPPRQASSIVNNLLSQQLMDATSRVGAGPIGSLSPREIFKVELAGPTHLRSETFSTYDGGRWRRRPITDASPATRPLKFPYFDPDDMQANYDFKTVRLTFIGPAKPKLPIPVPLQTMMSKFVRRGRDGSLTIAETPPPDYIFEGTYGVRKNDGGPTVAPRMESDAYRVYSNLEGISTRVADWAKEQSASGKTDFEKATLIKNAIAQQVRYNLNAAAAPSDSDPVEWFLLGPVKEGYCDLFASAMVHGARAIGIPSRYTIGYYPTKLEQDANGWYIVRQSDYHAWAELYFEGFGWIPFDATEGAIEVAGGERGASILTAEEERQQIITWTFNGFIAIAAIGGVILIMRSKKLGAGTASRLDADLSVAYRSFVDALETWSRSPKGFHETPDAYFGRVAPTMNGDACEAASLTERFVDAFYGPGPLTEPVVAGLKADAAQFKEKVRAEQKRGGRLRHNQQADDLQP